MVCISNFTAECGIYFEHSVDYNGKAYLVIYGYHADGNGGVWSRFIGHDTGLSQKMVAVGATEKRLRSVARWL